MLKPRFFILLLSCAITSMTLLAQNPSTSSTRQPRARDLGIPFDGTPGPLNAITDVPGVEVGYKTLISGEGRLVVGKGPVRTGVTAILPRGKAEHEECVRRLLRRQRQWRHDRHALDRRERRAGNAHPDYQHRQRRRGTRCRRRLDRQEEASGEFWYPVTAETADWPLNDIKGQHVTAQDAWDALNAATGGPLLEGNVGGGTGMVCNGFKGGTGTSSRKVGDYTVGVLVPVQLRWSQGLRVAGIPVAREMKLQKPCVEKKLDPPVLMWDGKPAPVCEGTSPAPRTARGPPRWGPSS